MGLKKAISGLLRKHGDVLKAVVDDVAENVLNSGAENPDKSRRVILEQLVGSSTTSTERIVVDSSNTTQGRQSVGSNWVSDNTLKLRELLELLHEFSSKEIDSDSVSTAYEQAVSQYGGLDDEIAKAALSYLASLQFGSVEQEDISRFKSDFYKLYDPIQYDSVVLTEIAGKRFVLTGDFAVDGGKDTISQMVKAAGGKTTKAISNATDYVVAGSLGSGAWGLKRYGGKIKDAVIAHLNGRDKPEILTEKELLSFLNSNCKDAYEVLYKREELYKRQWESAEVAPQFFQGLTEGQQRVFDLVKSGKNVYLTGLGGTGKSYIIERIIEWARRSGKGVIVCAPTGIAALNVGGTTIHRALGILPEKTLELNPFPVIPHDSAIPTCDLMIIDEISMCRADLFDYLSSVLRRAAEQRKEEGKETCQLVVVGDFSQLAPVVKREERKILNEKYGYDIGGAYAFMGESWDSWDFEKVELTVAIRQRDAEFVAALNACSVGDVAGVRWIKEHSSKKRLKDAIFLCGRNKEATEENEARLDELNGSLKVYKALSEGSVTGQDKPTQDVLKLKPGARVMALVNNSENTYMNGSLGTVLRCEDNRVLVAFDDLGSSYVPKHEWKITVPKLTDGKTQSEVIGTYTQIPLKLAWAITIHKAQGQTFESANIDPDCWDCGQLYTALSRLTNVSNMYLTRSLNDQFLQTSSDVVAFLKGEYKRPETRRSNQSPNAAKAESQPMKSDQAQDKVSTSPRHDWTKEEEDFIVGHPEMTARELGEVFGVTAKAVERRRAKIRKENSSSVEEHLVNKTHT